MATKIWLSKFDPKNEFVALRKLDVANPDPDKVAVMPGQRIDKSLFTNRQLRLMYEQRRIGIAGSLSSNPPAPPMVSKPKVNGNVVAPLPATTEKDEDPYDVVKKKGQWYIMKGDITVFGPSYETQARNKLKEILNDQAA